MESPKRHPKAIGFKSSVDFGPIPGAIMPICLNPSVTQKPEELCCGMGCPDEELLDLDTPSCSPVGAERKQDYRIIKDKSGKERYLRTAQVIFDEMSIRSFLQDHEFYSHDLNERQSNRRFLGDEVCPVHMAALLADEDALRLLIQHGADAGRRTSLGRTAWEVAQGANRRGSHQAVLPLLSPWS